MPSSTKRRRHARTDVSVVEQRRATSLVATPSAANSNARACTPDGAATTPSGPSTPTPSAAHQTSPTARQYVSASTQCSHHSYIIDGPLAARIEGLTDEVVREPSLLPAWSVGHVLTHLARNAEAMFHRIEATTRGEVIDQYVGGAEGRASEIESGAGRPANVLINDVISWSQRLDATFVSLPDDSWNRPVRSGRGDEHPVARLPFHRWWEVEVHLVDLAIGHTPADWPQELVDRALPRLVAGLANRADPRSLMAWTLGRGPAPGLESWL
jgi:maleylpyruvate isomerase